MIADATTRYCIIGAGAAGITACKNLRALNIPCDVIEREDDVGGNWYYGKPNSGVYRSTHLISSSRRSGYSDFPMPLKPDYPRHDQVLKYLRDYARHFHIDEHIQFNTAVEHCERDDSGYWLVTLSNGETRRYRGLIIANGHHWEPNLPEIPGVFDGNAIHSKFYKSPDVLDGKRVLIIGAGNTGCDVAVEAVHHAAAVYHSTRRGYYYIPKYIFGFPTDQVDAFTRKFMPLRSVRNWLNLLVIRIVLGHPTRYGLPQPDHRLLESHPLVNSLLPYHVGHGDIIPKPDVRELRGDRVAFLDGTEAAVDFILYATGYRLSFPFIDSQYLNWQGDGPGLYLHCLHPEYDNLFVLGMLELDSAIFWAADAQAQLIARFIHAQDHNPSAANQLRRIKAGPQPDLRDGIRHLNTPRHFIEVDHAAYRRELERLLKLLPG